VQQGKTVLNALLPLDQVTHVQMTLAALPLAWLRGVLAAAWPEGQLNGGSVAGAVALDLATDDTRISGRVDVAGIQLDSKEGNIAAQNLGASGSFRIENGPAATGVMFDGSLRGGQMLMGLPEPGSIRWISKIATPCACRAAWVSIARGISPGSTSRVSRPRFPRPTRATAPRSCRASPGSRNWRHRVR
jgi:hypothetical protein